MIGSAEEFVALRTSEQREEQTRATHEEAPLQVWRDVVERYPEMRCWVAHNKKVPVEVLALLSDDEDADVRRWVAMKRKLPESLQLKLAGDSNEPVRERIVWNAKATRATLEKLAADEAAEVRCKARERLAAGDYAKKDV